MYPRPDRPLVPRVLRDSFNIAPIPYAILDELGLSSETRWDDLDETVWRDHSRNTIERLAREVTNVTRDSVLDRIIEMALFEDRPSVDSLGLATRVENALRRAGLVEGGNLIPARVRDLMAASNFGVMSLLDVLTGLEARQPVFDRSADAASLPEAKISPQVRIAARALGRKQWSRDVTLDDPRVVPIFGSAPWDVSTIHDVSDRLAEQAYTPGAADSMVARILRIATELDSLRSLTLSEELLDVLRAISGRPTDPALAARFGFEGDEPTTLERAGQRVGVTRERARQLEKAFRHQVQGGERLWLPALDRAVSLADELVPVASSALEDALIVESIAESTFSVRSLVTACEVFGRSLPFEISPEGLLVRPGSSDVPAAARSAASRLVEHWGATTITEVQARLGSNELAPDEATTRLALESMNGFAWLDTANEWFWIFGTRNRMLNQVNKIMSVTGSIDLADLRRGVGRHHRMKGFRPPREVLSALCVQSGLYGRNGDIISGGPDLPDWRGLLGNNERVIVETLFDNGPVMRRDDLVKIVVEERGLNLNSVNIYLGYSPVIERFAPGVYGLRGARVGAAEVEALIPVPVRHRVLQDHGWTSDGRLWMAFRLSPSSVSTGVLGTPAAVRDVVQGSFPLSNETGEPLGRLVVASHMWGLSPFFQRWGVEAGDYVVLCVDTRKRAAIILAGTEELLLRYQSDERDS